MKSFTISTPNDVVDRCFLHMSADSAVSHVYCTRDVLVWFYFFGRHHNLQSIGSFNRELIRLNILEPRNPYLAPNGEG